MQDIGLAMERYKQDPKLRASKFAIAEMLSGQAGDADQRRTYVRATTSGERRTL
jgi:hypothetical protein